MANPTLLDMPIARDGNKNTIPTTDNGTTGLLSQQYGWQLINAIPPQQGGKAVKREDFNGALYLLSNLLFYLQKGWQFEWDAKQNYYAGCIVKDPNNGKMYQRLNDGTSNTAPHSDTTNWKLWDLSMLADYLPLAGGAMTGNIRKNVTTGSLEIAGSTSSGTGAWLELFGKDHSSYPWTFMMQAGSTSASRLIGKSDGTLTWGGDDLGGSAIIAKSLGSSANYIKHTSGLIIQFGYTESSNVSFPISFTQEPKITVTAITETPSYAGSVTVSSPSTSGFTINHNGSANPTYYWMAMGK